MSDLTTTLLQAGIDAARIDLHRSGFQRVPTEDRPRRRNGAVIVLSVRPLRVWFQNHGTGVTGMYREGGGSGLPSRDELHRIMHARREQQQERERSQAETAECAATLWRSCRPASDDNLYLVAKRVKAHGLRETDDGHLVVPMRDAGRLQSLQTIAPTGEKRFLSGGRVKGTYHGVGTPGAVIVIAEGYATAATIFEHTGYGTVAAFNAGNLRPVAAAMHKRFPSARIILAADNDQKTPGNPGLKYAREAAAAINTFSPNTATVHYPNFSMAALREPLTDWNDYFIRYGAGAFAACWEEVRHVG